MSVSRSGVQQYRLLCTACGNDGVFISFQDRFPNLRRDIRQVKVRATSDDAGRNRAMSCRISAGMPSNWLDFGIACGRGSCPAASRADFDTTGSSIAGSRTNSAIKALIESRDGILMSTDLIRI